MNEEADYKKAVDRLKFLNQTGNGFKFEVIPTLYALQSEAVKMENSVYNYRANIVKGIYVILTIDNINGDSVNKTHSNLGFSINGENIIFEQAKAKLNYKCKKPVINAIIEYCKINKIGQNSLSQIRDLIPDEMWEYKK